MACFVVPALEAILTTISTKVVEKKEGRQKSVEIRLDGEPTAVVTRIPFSRKLKWLSNMLWGGSALLAFEHVWHGEVVPWFPFLTAASNPEDASEMLTEMSTVGVAMAVLVTVVWLGMLGVSAVIERRARKELSIQD